MKMQIPLLYSMTTPICPAATSHRSSLHGDIPRGGKKEILGVLMTGSTAGGETAGSLVLGSGTVCSWSNLPRSGWYNGHQWTGWFLKSPLLTLHVPASHSPQNGLHWYLTGAESCQQVAPNHTWALHDSGSPGNSQLAVHTGSPGWAWPHANVHLTLYTVDFLDPTFSTAMEFTHCSRVQLCWCCFSYSCLSCYLDSRFSRSVFQLSYLYPEGPYLFVFFCSLLWNITSKCLWISLLFN